LCYAWEAASPNFVAGSGETPLGLGSATNHVAEFRHTVLR
jgi:hypothetical protein